MKKNTLFLLMMFVAVIFSATNKTSAQSCNQVEILYKSPDCYTPDHQDPGGASGQNKGCKEIGVCVDQPFVYTSSVTGAGWTYNWSVTGPAPVTINPNNTSPSVTIVWPQAGVFILTLTATDPSGNIFTSCLKVNVNAKPVANFTFTPNNVCAGSWITFTGTTTYSGSFMSTWNFGDPASGSNNYATYSGNTAVSHQYNSPGTYTVTLITYSFVTVQGGGNPPQQSYIKTCCADTITKQVTIKPGTLQIGCISTVCPGDTVKYTATGCSGVTWGPVVGGAMIGSTPTTITVVWGNGNPQGQITGSCGGCTASISVPIIPTNPIIVGNTSPCNTSTTSYTLPVLPGTFYTWSLVNTTTSTNYTSSLNTYPDNNTVWIDWQSLPAGTYQLTVTLENKHICCSSTGSITINPSDKWQVAPDQTVCAGPPGASLSTSPGPGNFSWNILPPNAGAAPLSFTGPIFNPVFANPGVYTVQVIETANMYCNSGAANPQQVKVTVLKSPNPGPISGPASGCTGSPYTYTVAGTLPPGYHFYWSITGGAGSFQPGNLPNATGSTATIIWTTLPGTISVVVQANGFPACPSAPVTFSVTQATIGSISGPLNVCVDGTGNYTLSGVPSTEPVTWTIGVPFTSLGTVTTGQGTPSIVMLWHGQISGGPWGPVTLNAATGCGNASLPNIMIYPKFTVNITKTGTDICNGGVTLTCNGAPGGSAYLWSPGGQTTSSVSGIVTPGFYTVTATNPPPTGGGGCVATATYEVIDPFKIVPLTCNVGYCNGTATNESLGVQVVSPLSGTFTYQWYSGVYPSGSPIGGATTPSFTAPSNGNYYVVVTYGTCTRYQNFTVKKLCCPDVNNPQITSVVRNSCNSFTFTGTCNPTSSSITWNFGNGVTMPGASGVPITYVYPPGTQPGEYCVTFCVGPPTPNPTNCTGNCAVRNVLIPLLASFTYKLGCNGCPVITNTSSVIPTSGAATATYSWNFGDGSPVVTTSSAAPPSHCYSSPTPPGCVITLTINYSDPSLGLICSSVATQAVTWLPLAIQVSPTPVCTGVQTNFNIVGSPSYIVTSATWNFGDGFTAYTLSSTHIYNTTGLQNVTLTIVDQLGNTCNANASVNVKPGIGPCTIQPGYICPGGSALLSAPSMSGATYQWEILSGSNWIPAPGANTGMTYSTTAVGFYHVVITGTNGCTCTSNKVEVKAVPKPQAIISAAPSSRICGPGNVMLSSPNHLPGYTSEWWNASYSTMVGSGMMFLTPVISVNTTIHLILKNEYGCADTCTLTIYVNPIPPQPVITASSLCEGVPITLTVTNYSNNITWSNGANTISTVVVAAGVYTATYTDPVTGCSSSKNIVINRRPPTDLFPHLCDSIPCTCRDSLGNVTVYAPKPLLGMYFSNYNIQWWFNGSPVGTNGPNPVFTPAQTGTYSIVVTDPITGCKDTSATYSIIVPKCDTCDCKESHWGTISVAQGNNVGKGAKANIAGTGEQTLKCNNNYNLNCNQPYTFNASFICKDTVNCKGKVTYKLQPPTGLPLTGNVAFSYTFTQNGVYILTLYGWCGDKICDSCTIDLTVHCEPLCDCKESHWGNITMGTGISGGDHPVDGAKAIIGTGNNTGTQKLQCNNTYNWNCNQPFTINANYICKDSVNCPGKVTFNLQPPTGMPVSGPVAFTYTPVITGTYVLTLYGWCGNKICDSCIIKISVSCECDCKGSKWGEKTVLVNNVSKPFNCMKPNDKPIDVKCNDQVTVNGNYICGSTNCQGSVTYTMTGPLGTSSGPAPVSFAANPTGVYSVTLYGWCGTTKCDSCVIRFKTVCDSACCPYTIKVDTTQTTSTYNQGYNATILTENFTINGLAGVPLTEVRAEVMNYIITDNYNKECMKCVNLPYTWASVQSAGNLGTPPVSPQITMFNSTTHPFSPTGAGQYQNPREVVWNNGSTFIINNNSSLGMSFLLPPPPAIDCCEFRGRICVKFTFRDEHCKECEVIRCFEFTIKSKKPF